MFWSVVNAAAVLALAQGQANQMQPKDDAAWRRVQSSFVTTLDAGKPLGTAALIDADGSFIAHKSSVHARAIDARTFDGRLLRLQVRSSDGTTQLVLMKVIGKLPNGLRPVQVPEGAVPPGKSLFAVTPSGPFRALYVNSEQPGVMGTNRRVLPMSEIRFESPVQAFGGALLISFDGEFLGVLGASLERRDAFQQNSLLSNNMERSGMAGDVLNFSKNAFAARSQVSQMGPGEMTVAYTIGPDVIRRVFDGFRSPTHQVLYPVLGVFCRDNVGGGALIQRVTAGGSADTAGLHTGDVILDIQGTLIRNQIDFGLAMNRQKIGSSVLVRIRRGAAQLLVSVSIGKMSQAIDDVD